MNVKHNQIRKVIFDGFEIGGETSFPIFKPAFALNVPIYNPDDSFEIVKRFYGTNNRNEIIKKALASDCDILCLKFNLQSPSEIEKAVEIFTEYVFSINKPLMISGADNDEIDRVLLAEIAGVSNRELIISYVNENTYKDIVPAAADKGHVLVLRSPIDINLAKELNILSADLGLDLNKILIDTDIGGLGYGLEYGYSIMEKIKLEGLNGDSYLNMPLISFVSCESLKTKEAKSDNFDENWGKLEDRTQYFELASCSAVMAAGADVIVMNYPPNISVMKGLK